ncbi:hypothetical protein TD95_004058 [Thielaviopsis punctulata]|uniref:Rab-GAP TBC domain-containing protein n=1 Tax=Thielaviopsis punctulata TaxID=72032 RepID=A0A0F4ZAS9_9PEZI|nr:hypothetical protein TD95_004058 [Thielaviopsis punctulata]
MFSSPSSGKKQPQQQEMVQVAVSYSSPVSAFWKPPKKTVHEPGKVIGAAYSHADMLKLDQLNISGSPLTQPNSPATGHSISRVHSTEFSPSRQPDSSSNPPFKNYINFLSTTNDDWKADADDIVGYDDDDDGDDFGLPSLSSMQRRTRRVAQERNTYQSQGQGQSQQHPLYQNTALGSAADVTPTSYGVGAQGFRNRIFSESGDIAIERPSVTYPMPKKTEGKILRPQYKEIVRDPANALHLINYPSIPENATAKEIETINSRITRIDKFKKFLQASSIPLAELRKLAWSGVPEEVRAMTWQLLLGYLPTNGERRVSTLERKRREYLDGVKQAFERGAQTTTSTAAGSGRARGLDEAIWHQISIDVPRTNPHIELYSYEATKRSLERILYVWAVRHPASGYVQGINDLVTPFFEVFLGVYIGDPDIESGMDPGQLPKAVLDAVEADSFWCLTKLLDGIQDHYIVAQPGIQRQVAALRDLTARIDSALSKHLESEHVEFIQFSFRWMNCLLMREISVKNTIRMWDTYLAEEQGFSEFHLYVCAAFLVKWSAKLLKMDFQEIMMFLQSLPTKDWTEKDIEMLLSEAFIWQSLFKGSAAHLRGAGSPRNPGMPLQL